MKWWRRDFIGTNFHKEDANAILRILLSHRHTSDAIVWSQNKRGVYSVKSGYYVARQNLKNEDWAECSSSPKGRQVWSKLWKLRVPNKIKVFGWRGCHNILPTRDNLVRRKILEDDGCMLYSRMAETGVHALWECAVAKDVWSSSMIRLQKCGQDQQDVLQLFQELMERLSTAEFEAFLVQSWLILNQRNTVMHGGKLKDPRWLNKRAKDYLEDFHQAQGQFRFLEHLQVVMTHGFHRLNQSTS